MVRFEAYALTLPLSSLRQHLDSIVQAAIRSVDAGTLVSRALSRVDVGSRPTWIVAAGKAAPGMAQAARRHLGASLCGGVVIAPTADVSIDGLEVMAAEHPEPGEGSRRAGLKALEIARHLRSEETLLVLLSGGASALMAVPAEGLTLAEKTAATRALLRGGADIFTLNTIRKHLSAIKGGWLAVQCPGPVRTLALSDVVGDDVSVIGSGPTVADPSTFSDARQALDRFSGLAVVPPSVWHRIDQGAAGLRPETPKPGDRRLAASVADVIGGRTHAMHGAADEAARLGYHVVTIDAPVIGEARESGPRHLDTVLRSAAALPRPACVVSSGETTVTVSGSGRGGRNQEFVLAVVERLASLAVPVAVASVGTDGIDGPTDAAGAVADSGSLGRAIEASLPSPQSFLSRNDAYHFFAGIGDLIRTGATGTNVGDLQVILLA